MFFTCFCLPVKERPSLFTVQPIFTIAFFIVSKNPQTFQKIALVCKQ